MPYSKIYDAGYAVSIFDIKTSHSVFRYRDEVYAIPTGSLVINHIKPSEIPGLEHNTSWSKIPVASIEAVRKAYENSQRSNSAS